MAGRRRSPANLWRTTWFTVVTPLTTSALLSCAVGVDPGQGSPDAGIAVAPPTASATGDLRIVQIPRGRLPRTLVAREVWSEVKPWRDSATGDTCMVVGVDASLEASLRAEGMVVRPLAEPPELPGWPPEQQQLFSAVAKKCSGGGWASVAYRGGSANKVLDDAHSPIGVPNPYSSYYLPYDADSGVADFATRVNQWRDRAVSAGYFGGAKAPPGIFGGWPLRAGEKRYVVSRQGATDPERAMVWFDIGWDSAGDWQEVQGGPMLHHEGRRAVVFVVANQHPRELVAFESAWRLAQRIVAAYAKGGAPPTLAEEWGRNRLTTFWRAMIDAGVHVVIVPSGNPTGYQQVSRTGGDWASMATTSTKWQRNNGNKVDLNRNWPEHWLQGGMDGNEIWGTAPDYNQAYYAGTSPGSEPEVRAMMEILATVLGRTEASAKPAARLPAVALDLHSAYGSVSTASHVSLVDTLHTPRANEAWFCGLLSDCIPPDQPSWSAIFGNNARPTVMGTTGLASTLTADDPDLPYIHGRDTLNFYPTSGDAAHAFASPRWAAQGQAQRLGMPAATVEVTAYRSGKPFGFGTCTPPADATLAIDEVVRDLMPLIARMAESSFDPADPPSGWSEKRFARCPSERTAPCPPIHYPAARDIVNLGVVSEAPAVVLGWRAMAECPSESDDRVCYDPKKNKTIECQPLLGHKCDGPWWSTFRALSTDADGMALMRNAPLRYWALAVRRPDPDSFVAEEADAAAVRLRRVDCEPADKCTSSPTSCVPDPSTDCSPYPTPLVRVRDGSSYDLFAFPLFGTSGGLPSRLTVQREVLYAGAWKSINPPRAIVAAEPPVASPFSTGGSLMLGSMLRSGEHMFDVRLDAPIRNRERLKRRLRLIWPGAPITAMPLVPGGIDYPSLATGGLTSGSWVDYSGDFADFMQPYAWYSYDFDLSGMASNDLAVTGTGIVVTRDDGGVSPAKMFPPVVSALVSSASAAPPPCALGAIGSSSAALEAGRALRDQVLLRGPWGRRYAEAYAWSSPEIVRLIALEPELRVHISALARAGLLAAQATGTGLVDVREVIVAAYQALRIVERRGSLTMRLMAARAVMHLPDLAREIAHSGPIDATTATTLQGGIHARW